MAGKKHRIPQEGATLEDLGQRVRGQSRDKHVSPAGTKTLAVVVDGIDHSKFRYPRSNIFNAKDLAVHARARLDVMGRICRLWVPTPQYVVFVELAPLHSQTQSLEP